MAKRLSGSVAIALMAATLGGHLSAGYAAPPCDNDFRREPWKGKGKRKKAQMR